MLNTKGDLTLHQRSGGAADDVGLQTASPLANTQVGHCYAVAKVFWAGVCMII